MLTDDLKRTAEIGTQFLHTTKKTGHIVTDSNQLLGERWHIYANDTGPIIDTA